MFHRTAARGVPFQAPDLMLTLTMAPMKLPNNAGALRVISLNSWMDVVFFDNRKYVSAAAICYEAKHAPMLSSSMARASDMNETSPTITSAG